ncbi:MAG TPA: hypothetical protein H9809_00145 [Candidatus Blautia pullicola]|uniref:Uncharacterized protein n=1 Tax=Candidatus Blautia pullicola TaxID=2838498 RepID=A0A9D2FPU7_9FIRM|nr:hypothetical protein [Candidatus Blautia pullicola]
MEIFVENPEILKKAFETADYLPKMYNEKTGHKLGMFCLDEAVAEFCSLRGVEESLDM